MNRDLLAWLCTAFLAVGYLHLCRLIGSRGGLPRYLTRKIIHIGESAWDIIRLIPRILTLRRYQAGATKLSRSLSEGCSGSCPGPDIQLP